MNEFERLAIAHACAGAFKDVESQAREACNKELMEAYDADGIEKMALRVGKEKVGEFTVVYASDGYEVVDDKFMDFALANGLAHEKRTLKPDAIPQVLSMLSAYVDPDVLSDFIEESIELNQDWDKYFERRGGEVVMAGTYEIVPGVVYRPKRVKNTRITGCKPDEVLPQLTANDMNRLLGESDG